MSLQNISLPVHLDLSVPKIWIIHEVSLILSEYFKILKEEWINVKKLAEPPKNTGMVYFMAAIIKATLIWTAFIKRKKIIKYKKFSCWQHNKEHMKSYCQFAFQKW